MQLELSRLELKEVLQNLSPNCEPEVRQKLEIAFGQKVTVIAGIDVHQRATSLDDPREAVRAGYNEAEAEIWRPLTRERDFPKATPEDVSDEEIASINAQRKSVYDAEQRIREAQRRRGPIVDSAELQVAPAVTKVPMGQRNQFGDMCVKLDADGNSVFQCKQGHGYSGVGLSTPGCPRCWSAGGAGGEGEAAEPAKPTMNPDNPSEELV